LRGNGIFRAETKRPKRPWRFKDAGAETNLARQPRRFGGTAELTTAYVMLADPLSSYVSGATIAVTGGKPIL
jgi:NAD(P)-dependent dehydrogenase (short-subunit alcohol dehydrogenase family)